MNEPDPTLAAPRSSGAAGGLAGSPRPVVQGKFLYTGESKFWVRGVTYGTFRPGADGEEYPADDVLTRDFTAMAAHGVNAVRTYTAPPLRLLDAAARYGLRVLVGLPWEQHVAFLDDRDRQRSITARIRSSVRACAGHPAILAYAVGNEIPAPIVRWHGARGVERFLQHLWETAKDADPDGLVTYVNYPTTEYLELPFLDLVCFNVYLEARDRFQAYLARLQNLAGDRPLIMAELGLDSRRHGLLGQALSLDWQLRTAFSAGCAGAFVFAWTDEWHRGGWDVKDWDFGLTDRLRRPKPALAAVRDAFETVPFVKEHTWPRVSVVVCSYNGARTIDDCLTGCLALDYPNFEIIVVNDGSKDTTPEIVKRHGVRLISTPNRGLSSARNTGCAAATGDIVAYIDDDAWPDPHWLTYLVTTLTTTAHIAAGGPNLPPPGDGPIAAAVAEAPGGPAHVLVSDTEAEHVPGCNMAFWKSALEAIGGFDAKFRTAGDDVDVCWRLQQTGGTIGFHAAAVVWHHRRNSIRAYLRQQIGYGRAEAMLERKWPEKYNAAGHATWSGRVYGSGPRALAWWRRRIYHGPWGAALFQSLYQPTPGLVTSLVTMPEWLLIVATLAALSLLGLAWKPLLHALPLLVLSVALPVAHALVAAARAPHRHAHGRHARLQAIGLTALLYLLQPAARLRGRLEAGLTPWRRSGSSVMWPRAVRLTSWSEQWHAPAARLARLEAALRHRGAAVMRGGEWDRWDLAIVAGLLGGARLILVVEDHGHGRQLTRLHAWPRASRVALATQIVVLALAGAAVFDGAWLTALMLSTSAAVLGLAIARACGTAMARVVTASRTLEVVESHSAAVKAAA